MPRYLHKDKQGKVLGHYANENPSATELVPDDHPDLLAFHAAREAAKQASKNSRVQAAASEEARLVAIENRIGAIERALQKSDRNVGK